jgi:hypothetical protein
LSDDAFEALKKARALTAEDIKAAEKAPLEETK